MAQAQSCHKAGRLDEANRLYNEILKNNPNNPDALLFLGLINHQRGNNGIAAELMNKAINLQPKAPHYHCNLALVLTAQGLMQDAITTYRRAVQLKPDYAEAYFNMGILLSGQGNLDEAVAAYKQVIRLNPGFDRAYSSLGNTLNDMGQVDAAIESFRHALRLNPKSAAAHFNLANALLYKEQFPAAVDEYKRALEINPELADACRTLGDTLMRLGRQDEAISYYRRAANIAPQDKKTWQTFTRGLRGRVPGLDLVRLEMDLVQCLLVTGIDHQGLARTAVAILRQVPALSRYLSQQTETAMMRDELDAELRGGELLRSLNSPLLLLLLENTLVTDVSLEHFLTQLRRTLLSMFYPWESASVVTDQSPDFVCALAHQCFLNEYVFFQTQDEQEQVRVLGKRVAEALGTGRPVSPTFIALLACYLPLHQITACHAIPDELILAGGELFRRLIDRQVNEPLEEQTIRQQITCLTKINDGVSSEVRSQYEENPYPRWASLFYNTPRPFNVIMFKKFPHLATRQYTLPCTPDILIAGCGTGSHAIGTATRFLNARVTAVDLSLTSLAYAIRKSREMKVTNIDYFQADILELGMLDRRFDVIESSGVLHHLRDPVRGWRILRGLLKPGGYMNIGLYSEIARKPVVDARKMIADSGLGASADEIRQFRRTLYTLSPDVPAKRVMALFNDFYSTSDCRDLLFHVQEHRFTLPQIEAILLELGLEFIGFELADPETLMRYRARFPEDCEATNLMNWHQFEEENTQIFAGMYQFWLRKP